MAFTGRGSESLRLDEATISEICATEIGRWNIRGKRVLAIVPDQTRTAPMDVMFRVLHEHHGTRDARLRRPHRPRDTSTHDRGRDQQPPRDLRR